MYISKSCFLPVLESIESLKLKCNLLNIEFDSYQVDSNKNLNKLNKLSINKKVLTENLVNDIFNIFNNNKINTKSFTSNYRNENLKKNSEKIQKITIKKSLKKLKNVVYDNVIQVKTRNEFAVENVVNHYFSNSNLYFEVKWLHWSNEYNTWEKIDNLAHSFDLVNNYLIKNNIQYSSILNFLKISNCYMLQLLQHFVKLILNFSLEDPFILNKLVKLNKNTYNQNIIKKKLDQLRDLKRIYTHKKMYCNQSNLKKKNFYLELLDKLNILKVFKNEYEFFKCVEDRIDFQKKSQIWLENINKILFLGNNLPIRFENLIDLDLPPQNFKFVNFNTYDTLPFDIIIQINHCKDILKCDCVKNCLNSYECCPNNVKETSYYNPKGLIRNSISTKGPIFECNSNCGCDQNCFNRVIQRGTQIKLAIFKTNDGRGWGVKTLERIPKNKFVTQFLGEIITSKEAQKREIDYSLRKEKYLFNLDFNFDLSYEFVIDATQFGNVSHYINHSCNPNLEVYIAYIDHIYENIPNIAFFSKCNINAGDELTFDYFPSKNKNVLNFNDCLNEQDETYCKCKEPNCKNFIF